MPKTKKCRNCGIEFEPKTSLQSCCNIICTQEYTYKRKKLRIPVEKHKICPECGKEFTLDKITKAYCSNECSYKAQKKTIKSNKSKKKTKTAVKKTKRQSVTALKTKAWNIFSRYIRTRDCLEYSGNTEYGKCITCNKIFPFKQLQSGHFISGRTKPVLFNEEIVFSQCMGCNVFNHGAMDSYVPYMINRYGIDKVMEFYELRHNKDKIWTTEELEEIITKYTNKLKELA